MLGLPEEEALRQHQSQAQRIAFFAGTTLGVIVAVLGGGVGEGDGNGFGWKLSGYNGFSIREAFIQPGAERSVRSPYPFGLLNSWIPYRPTSTSITQMSL